MGTWALNSSPENVTEAIASAMEAGYRHFDGATAYNNQKMIAPGIKEGLRRTGLKRSDIWITSKIWSNKHAGQVKAGMDQNAQELGLDYVDLTLMHFPVGGSLLFPKYDYVDVCISLTHLLRERMLILFIKDLERNGEIRW